MWRDLNGFTVPSYNVSNVYYLTNCITVNPSHSLRHRFACIQYHDMTTKILPLGVSKKTNQKQLGHNDSYTDATKACLHVLPNRLCGNVHLPVL